MGGVLGYDDEDYREILREIDDSDEIEVTSWEAEFIDSIIWHGYPLSESQRAVIQRMEDKYL